MKTLLIVLSGVCVGALGCLTETGIGSTTSDDSTDGPDLPVTVDELDVTGTAMNTWITEAGQQKDVPAASLDVVAVYQVSGGAFEESPAIYDPATGKFVIHGVPEGPYYLRVGQQRYFAMTARSCIHLGSLIQGRPDAEKIQQSPTSLILDLTNVTPWGERDMIELFSLGAGAEGTGPDWGLVPDLGSTSLTGFPMDMGIFDFPGLIDGAKGDTAILTHHTTRVASGLPYASLGQVLTLPSFTVSDGQPTALSGAFQDVPQNTLTVDWDTTAFVDRIMDAVPGAIVRGGFIQVNAEPSGKSWYSEGWGPYLAFASIDDLSADLDLSLEYGNPFPATYGVIGQVGVDYKIDVNAPGQERSLIGLMTVVGPTDTLLQGKVMPLVSPPIDVTIGGVPATSYLTGVGSTPVIAWQAPALGAPQRYVVTLYSFEPTDKKLVASITTVDTSVTVPSGVLQQGTIYGARVSASTGQHDPEEPLMYPNHTSYATALTRAFTP